MYSRCLLVVLLFVAGIASTANAVHRNNEPIPKIVLWPSARIPYKFDKKVTLGMAETVKQLMAELANKTCIRFEEANGNDDNYITIHHHPVACAASNGFQPKSTGSKMYLNDLCLVQKGRALRQFLLAVGLSNEHNRPDRDEYVKINFDNIVSTALPNFEKVTTGDPTAMLNLPYDYGSLMQFPELAFSTNGKSPTIVPLKPLPVGLKLGQREGLSDLDVRKVNLLYKCKI